MKAFRVVCWMPNIKPEDRNNRNMSDGAQFRQKSDAIKWSQSITIRGGLIQSIQTIENSTFGYRSIEEYENLGRMTLQQLEEIKTRDQ